MSLKPFRQEKIKQISANNISKFTTVLICVNAAVIGPLIRHRNLSLVNFIMLNHNKANSYGSETKETSQRLFPSSSCSCRGLVNGL